MTQLFIDIFKPLSVVDIKFKITIKVPVGKFLYFKIKALCIKTEALSFNCIMNLLIIS